MNRSLNRALARYAAAVQLIRLSDELRLVQRLAVTGAVDPLLVEGLARHVRDAERVYESYRTGRPARSYRTPERFRDRGERGFRP